MLDIRFIRRNPDVVKTALEQRGIELDLEPLLALDEERRQAIQRGEDLKNKRNTVSKELGRLKKAGEDITPQKEEMRLVGREIAELDDRIRQVEADLHDSLLRIPNIPQEGVPVGQTDEDNVTLRTEGAPPSFDFDPKPHWDLGESLRLWEPERSTRLAGSGFPFLRGEGARLERALIQFMLDVHTREHGYTEVAPPFLCNTEAMTGTGQLPKMADDMYRMPDDSLYLIPTAEVPVTNLYREEIIEDPLPVSLVAYSPCFRREAGAAGRDTRGLIRVHQFSKVEMVKFVEPDQSDAALDHLVQDAEDILQRLGLHYRVRALCTGDLSFAAARCYDIELWAPGYEDWLEVSSCSNFGDFQARRAGIRYRTADRKTAFVHTLNGSGVALPRLMIALLESGQRADGSIELPPVLADYLGGRTRIDPPAPA